MQASIVDLRYRMADIKHALTNSEVVTLTDRGQVIADIFPRNNTQKHHVEQQPFFGMLKNQEETSVDKIMKELRGGRYDAL